jgi:hypothetical protein
VAFNGSLPFAGADHRARPQAGLSRWSSNRPYRHADNAVGAHAFPLVHPRLLLGRQYANRWGSLEDIHQSRSLDAHCPISPASSTRSCQILGDAAPGSGQVGDFW